MHYVVIDPPRRLGRQNPHGNNSIEALLAYSYLFDPAVASIQDRAPIITSSVETFAREWQTVDSTVILLPSPPNEDWAEPLADWVDLGGRVLVVMPGPIVAKALGLSHRPHSERVYSQKETWRPFGTDAELSYPVQCSYQLWEAPVQLGSIGDRPASLSEGRVTAWTIDVFQALAAYRFYAGITAYASVFANHLRALLYVAAGLTSTGVTEIGSTEGTPHIDLRRDCHSLGLATALLVYENPTSVDSRRPIADAFAAASAVASRPAAATDALSAAFSHLREYRESCGLPAAVFLDGFHSGVLLPDGGYSELEWPQFAADWTRELMRLVDRYGYTFSVDMAIGSLRRIAERHPQMMEELAEYSRKGSIEFVNGTYGQPYAYLYSTASFIRQLEAGHRFLLNQRCRLPQTYASQEFALSPTVPGILSQFGYRYGNHSALHKGSAPESPRQTAKWIGGDDSRLIVVAATSLDVESDPLCLFWNCLRYAQRSKDAFDAEPILFNFCDQLYHPHFREEMIRIASYDTVFGEFRTHRQLLSERNPTHRLAPKMDDYDDAPLSGWKYDGPLLRTHSNCLRAEIRLRRIEAEVASAARTSKQRPAARLLSELARCWELLCEYQHHDVLLVPHAWTGSHTGHSPSYRGPYSVRPLERSAEALFAGLSERIATLEAQYAPVPAPGAYDRSTPRRAWRRASGASVSRTRDGCTIQFLEPGRPGEELYVGVALHNGQSEVTSADTSDNGLVLSGAVRSPDQQGETTFEYRLILEPISCEPAVKMLMTVRFLRFPTGEPNEPVTDRLWNVAARLRLSFSGNDFSISRSVMDTSEETRRSRIVSPGCIVITDPQRNLLLTSSGSPYFEWRVPVLDCIAALPWDTMRTEGGQNAPPTPGTYTFAAILRRLPQGVNRYHVSRQDLHDLLELPVPELFRNTPDDCEAARAGVSLDANVALYDIRPTAGGVELWVAETEGRAGTARVAADSASDSDAGTVVSLRPHQFYAFEVAL